MQSFLDAGYQLREKAKEIVINYLRTHAEGQPIKQAKIFKECGFDWGDYPKSNSTRQQYWGIALLQELRKEGRVEQIGEKGPWRLKEA
jgi:hypothetical protein